jgi:hypothetical protein
MQEGTMKYRLSVLFASPLLLAFAPVPVLKPMTDPDKAIQQFEAESLARNDATVAERKKRLAARLEELHTALVKRRKAADAERVRERLLLLESMDGDRPLGEGAAPAEVLKKASVDGKYGHLLHVLYVPADRASYREYNDFGYWPGTSYLQHGTLKQGHWVYAHPRWFIWRDGPTRP